jgi:hypothetical protein
LLLLRKVLIFEGNVYAEVSRNDNYSSKKMCSDVNSTLNALLRSACLYLADNLLYTVVQFLRTAYFANFPLSASPDLG